ncbi:hypothetical protein ACET3X_007912 [Alternaria dauci]|uniref:Uncharacterized protein n=1 Tax=Alternaria dauci TaxID=48095 RepID=A0ABR3UDB3_9PLEO
MLSAKRHRELSANHQGRCERRRSGVTVTVTGTGSAQPRRQSGGKMFHTDRVYYYLGIMLVDLSPMLHIYVRL